jgi:hypothetical protein
MDLYDIHPMETFNEDDDKYAGLLEDHGDLSYKFSREGKYKYLEKVFDDIPQDEMGYHRKLFAGMFEPIPMDLPISLFFMKGVEFESKEKVLDMLIEYDIRTPKGLFDVNDGDVVDIIIRKELEKNGGENSFLTEIGNSSIGTLIHYYETFGTKLSKSDIDHNVDMLRNLGNHRDILFRDSSQEDIERLLDNLLQSYNEFKKVNNLISEGDDTDVLMKGLIKRIRDSNMTKSALKR